MYTFLRLVLTMNSRARCWIGAGSSGRRTMLLSRGSPGTIAQWSNTERQNACPWVWYLKSVSKPKDSITGKNAWTKKRCACEKPDAKTWKHCINNRRFYQYLKSNLDNVGRGPRLRNISSNMSTPARQDGVYSRETIHGCLDLKQDTRKLALVWHKKTSLNKIWWKY